MKQRKELVYRLLTEKLNGSISLSENRLLEQLIAEDADTAFLWEQVKTLHQQRGAAMLQDIDENEAWDKMSARLQLPQESNFINRVLQRKWPLVSMAAASIAVILVSAFFIASNMGSDKPLSVEATAVLQPVIIDKPAITDIQFATANGVVYSVSGNSKIFKTAEGATVKADEGGLSFNAPASMSSKELNTLKIPAKKNYHIKLCDGTEVWLNSATTFWFPFAFNGNTRDVYVEGEALFKVAKNAAKPFIVHTGGTDVKVLGTTFNVNTYEKDRVTTSLVEGSVLAYSPHDTLHLAPGDQSVFKQGRKLVKTSFNEEEVLGWRDGVYYFHNAPLSSILGMASKWYGIKVRFNDPRTCDLSFSGAIDKSKSVNVLLENLRLSSGLHFSWVNEELYVSPGKDL